MNKGWIVQIIGPVIDVEFSEEGTFVVTKHPGSGGLVSGSTVREQLLYEMGHPQVYITPDVIADFTSIRLEDESRIAFECPMSKAVLRPICSRSVCPYRMDTRRAAPSSSRVLTLGTKRKSLQVFFGAGLLRSCRPWGWSNSRRRAPSSLETMRHTAE